MLTRLHYRKIVLTLNLEVNFSVRIFKMNVTRLTVLPLLLIYLKNLVFDWLNFNLVMLFDLNVFAFFRWS